MRSTSWLPVCGVLVLASCSGSDGDAVSVPDSTDADAGVEVPVDSEPDVVPTTPTLDGEAAAELCPDAGALSAATGVEFSPPGAVGLENDLLGTDPAAGATSCAYNFLDSSTLSVTLHNSAVDTSFLETLPEEEATLTPLPTGELQLQFNGQAGCEIYGEQISVIAFVFEEIPDLDTCALVGTALAAAESA